MNEAPLAVRIMHVDDDERIIRSVARVLRSNGYSAVEGCTDSTAAIERIQAFEPDVLLLDLVMPEVGGRALLDQLRSSMPEVRVIVLTAEYDARAAVDCMRAGARDFLIKPVRAEELLAALTRVLEESALSFEAASLRDQFFSTQLKHPQAFSEIVTAFREVPSAS